MDNKQDILYFFNSAAERADAELLAMEQSEEQERTATDDKKRRKANERWNRHNAKHSFHTGKLAGIELTLSALGLVVVKNDEGRAVDICAAND